MRVSRRIAVTTKLALVCLLAVAALAQASGFRADPDGGTAAAKKVAAFRARGNLGGLFPGAKTTLRVRVTNNGRSPITLTRLAVKARSTTAGCPASTLRITPFRGKKGIKGRATVKLSLQALMNAGAPDACQGNRYQLVYSGKAKRA